MLSLPARERKVTREIERRKRAPISEARNWKPPFSKVRRRPLSRVRLTRYIVSPRKPPLSYPPSLGREAALQGGRDKGSGVGTHIFHPREISAVGKRIYSSDVIKAIIV